MIYTEVWKNVWLWVNKFMRTLKLTMHLSMDDLYHRYRDSTDPDIRIQWYILWLVARHRSRPLHPGSRTPGSTRLCGGTMRMAQAQWATAATRIRAKPPWCPRSLEDLCMDRNPL